MLSLGPPRGILELSWWLRWYRIRLYCRRPEFSPWVGKILRRRKWQPTPVFFPGKSHGQGSHGVSRIRHGLVTKPAPDQIRSVTQSCLTLCDPMNRSRPGLPVHHQLPEFTQTHIHRVSDATQPSHPLLSPSPPAPNPSQHQNLFQ